MMDCIRNGKLDSRQLDILQRGYESGFSAKELKRLAAGGEAKQMEETCKDIQRGRRLQEMVAEAERKRKRRE